MQKQGNKNTNLQKVIFQFMFLYFGFQTDITLEVMDRASGIVCWAWPSNKKKCLHFGKGLDHFLDTDKSRIFENASGGGLRSTNTF